MVTIARIVEKIVQQRPFVQEALSRGIVNNAALAEEITPLVEKELGQKAKFSAVNMAIRRLQEKLGTTFVTKARFDPSSGIIVQSDLIEITSYKSEDAQTYIKRLYDLVDYKRGDFLTITQGLHEVMVITNDRYEKKILELFPKKIIKKIIRHLSSLTVGIPQEAIDTIGLFYIATRALNWENINIVDIVSTFTEMTFIVKEVDTARAFDALKRLIETDVRPSAGS